MIGLNATVCRFGSPLTRALERGGGQILPSPHVFFCGGGGGALGGAGRALGGGGEGGARSRSRIAGSGGRASLRPAATGRVADGGGPMKTNEGPGSIYLHVRHIALKIKMRVCKYFSSNYVLDKMLTSCSLKTLVLKNVVDICSPLGLNY